MKVYIKRLGVILFILTAMIVLLNFISTESLAAEPEDFSYYYEGAEDTVYSCSAAEINDVIKNATGNMVIEMNKNVILPESSVFESYEGKYSVLGYMYYRECRNGLNIDTTYDVTIDLNNHSLSVTEGARIMRIANSGEVTIKNGTLKGAAVNRNAVATPPSDSYSTTTTTMGAAIYANEANVKLDNIEITGNKGATPVEVVGGKLNATNININNNIGASTGAALKLTEEVVATIKDSVFTKNEFPSASYGGTIYSADSILEATNIKVIENGKNSTTYCAGILTRFEGELKLTDSLIADNYAGKANTFRAGGLTVDRGIVELTNTVIRDNIGGYCGGLGATTDANTTSYNTEITITGGAIYNNQAESSYKNNGYAHDILIDQRYKTDVNILSADSMVSDDTDKSFAGYSWNHDYGNATIGYQNETLKTAIEINLNDITKDDGTVYHMYTATAAERMVAAIGEQQYKTIQEAVDAAKDGETVKLIVGDTDDLGNSVSETVLIDGEKSITIDLNGKKWSAKSSSETALTIGENAGVKVVGEGTLRNIEHNGTSLEIDSSAEITKVTLADGRKIKAGEKFPTDKLSKTLSIVLTAEEHEKIKAEDVVLIENSKELSEDLIKQIKLVNKAALVIVKTDDNNNVIAHTLKGVFLNGKSGDDSNDGVTLDTPVKTFAKAKEILESSNLESIVITGTVTVDKTEEWLLPEGKNILRYAEFKDYLVDVKGELTLKNITIDGNKDEIESKTALIKVEETGILNINDGAKLINNSHTKQNVRYTEAGGAVYSEGTVNMTGGEVSRNTSWYGAGIQLYGEKATMTLDGGTIKNNNTKDLDSTTTSAGGGIAAMQGAALTMNGGEVSNNETKGSHGIGGGIFIGVVIANENSVGSTFLMNGGKIDSNVAKVDGGGLYVQCLSVATLKSGEITNNECSGTNIWGNAEGIYGGGGIYVNGGKKGYKDGELYITSAYISGNTAKGKEGAAIAGCGTSTVYIYPESAIIYNNEGTSEIYVNSTKETGFGNTAKVDISKYAISGIDNEWTDGEKVLTAKELKTLEPETKLVINNKNAEALDTTGESAKVKITGNTSATRGGGIGTNGYVQIGEDKEITTEIKVTITWDDDDNSQNLRPNKSTINLYANGKKIETIEITEESNWEHIFEKLPKYDDNGELIVYTITEGDIDEYEIEIDEFNIINKFEADSENKEDEETTKPEDDDKKEEDKKEETSGANTSDNITISFAVLVLAIVVFIKAKKAGKYTPKHRK